MQSKIWCFFSHFRGLSPQLCEMNFLNKVKWLEMYGVDLQPVIVGIENKN